MLDRYVVYIMASQSRMLYVGITSDLVRRALQHRACLAAGFAARYRITRLVHYEAAPHVRAALAREAQIRQWQPQDTLALIEAGNPGWHDLAEPLLLHVESRSTPRRARARAL